MQYSIVKLSDVRENHDFRFDAEFYHPDFILNHFLLKKENIIEDFLISKPVDRIQKLGENVEFNYLDISNISYHDFNTTVLNTCNAPSRATYILHKKDICISTVRPNLNTVAFIYDKIEKIVCTSGLCVLRADSKKVLPEMLYMYSKTKFFIKALDRYTTATMYPAISNKDILKTNIPTFTYTFQHQIATLVNKSYELKKQAKELYQQAEELLLEELGLIDFKPKHQLSYIKTFTATQQAKRFDAEYFQPKYEAIEDKIKSYKGGFSTIKDEFNHIQEVTPIQDTYKYVEIGSINVGDGSIEASTLSKKELPANAKRKLKENQLIVSKVRTYRGAIAIVDSDDYIGSGAFTVLEAKNNNTLNVETLFVFLRTKVMKDWSLKPNTGTSYPVIIDEDVLGISIPSLPLNLQQQISNNIKTSKKLKAKAKHLLEVAKKAVEIAIEENEEKAEEYIKEQTIDIDL